MIKRLKAKNDFIFQRIFGREENKSILISLLNAILNPKEEDILQDIEIVENTKLEKDRIEDKQGILDVRATTLGGVQINIEIQLINQYNMDKRTLFYWSKMYTEQLKAGESFNNLKKTITINILDFSLLQTKKYHSIFHLWEDTEKDYMLTDMLEIHFIELAKFRNEKQDLNNPLQRWLLFLEDTSQEVISMIESFDPAIEKAGKVLEWLSSDEETKRLYDLREKALHDEATRIEGAKEEGLQEGLQKGLKEGLQKGLQEGLQKGLQEGLQEGLQKGREEEKKEIAKAMISKNIPIALIMEVTSFSKEQIEELEKEM